MILVPCPYCGARNAAEFHWKGELRERPDPSTATPAQWRNYLYMRRNAAGWSREKWFHHAGCGRYFTLERNTVTNEFRNELGTELRSSTADATIGKSSALQAEPIEDSGAVR